MPFEFAGTHVVHSHGMLAKLKRTVASWIKPAPKPVLERIRLTPVPIVLAEAHKRQVEAALAEAARHDPVLRVYQNRAYWHIVRFHNWPSFKNDIRNVLSYSFFPAPRSQSVWFTSVVTSISASASPVPDEVVKLVNKTVSRMRRAGVEANVKAEVFYTDPVLHLSWEEDGDHKKVCLAIWDYDAAGKGVIHEIAKLG